MFKIDLVEDLSIFEFSKYAGLSARDELFHFNDTMGAINKFNVEFIVCERGYFGKAPGCRAAYCRGAIFFGD